MLDEAILMAKRPGPAHARMCLTVDILKTTQQGAAPVRLDVLDGVHIGATWRIRLNHPCAAAKRPYVELLRPLLIFIFLTAFISK